MDAVIGKNEVGKPTIFTIVDRIDRKILWNTKEFPVEAKDELETLYCSLGKHYDDAWQNNQPYRADFQNHQFMYGVRQPEAVKHCYIVDTDAQFYQPGQSRKNPETGEELHPLEWVLHNVCESLTESEGKFQPPVRFEKARQQMLESVTMMFAQKPNDRWLLKAKRELES